MHSLKARIRMPATLAFLVFSLPAIALGADHYIWCGATGPGTGADWNHAWPDISVVNGTVSGSSGSNLVTFATAPGTALPGIFQNGIFVYLDDGAIVENGVGTGYFTAAKFGPLSNVTLTSFQFNVGHFVATSLTASEVTASAALTRGDTYYFAGSSSCTYAPHDFADADSGTMQINILKATSSNAGNVGGWQSRFGTSPAGFTDGSVYPANQPPSAPAISFTTGGSAGIPNATSVTVEVTYLSVQGETTPSVATTASTGNSGPYNLVVTSPSLSAAGLAGQYRIYACTGENCTVSQQSVANYTWVWLGKNATIPSINSKVWPHPVQNTTGGQSFLWQVAASYYTFDGQYGSGNAAGQFGFLVRGSSKYTRGMVFLSGPLSNLTFSHVEVDGINCCNNGALTNDRYTWRPQGGTSYSNITMTYDYTHDVGAAPFRIGDMSNLTMDHCWMARTSTPGMSGGGLHGEAVFLGVGQSTTDLNITFSNNIWEDVTGTGIIVLGNGKITNVYIYNNIFFQGSNGPLPGAGTWYLGDGAISDLAGALKEVKIYNNTFYNLTGASNAGININAKSPNFGTTNDVDIQNNLFYNVAAPHLAPAGKHSHNTLINSPPYWATVYAQSESVPSSVSELSFLTNSGGVVTATTRGINNLRDGKPVAVLRAQVSSQRDCAFNTMPPYPTASSVAAAHFSYKAQKSGSGSCSGGLVMPASPLIFVNPPLAGGLGGKDFHLINDTMLAGLKAGKNLTSVCSSWNPPCNIDLDGNLRPAGESWTVGAYQYLSHTTHPSEP